MLLRDFLRAAPVAASMVASTAKSGTCSPVNDDPAVQNPLVYVIEADYDEPLFRLPDTDVDLDKWLVPDKAAGLFRVGLPDGGRVVSKFHSFYEVGEGFPYKMYFDRDQLPVSLW